MSSIKKGIGLGFLTWLTPFVAAFVFYTPDGDIWINPDLFKSIMTVMVALITCFLLTLYFKNVKSNYLKEGFIVGLVWLAMNLALDIAILLPMSKMPLDQYAAQIGLRYLMIPIISITFGWALERAQARR